MSDYSPLIQDHFRNPRYVGKLPTTEDVFHAEAKTPASDAIIRINIKCNSQIIEETRFLAHGCVATLATASWLTESLRGLELVKARHIDMASICEALDLPVHKRFCAVMAEDLLNSLWKQIK